MHGMGRWYAWCDDGSEDGYLGHVHYQLYSQVSPIVLVVIGLSERTSPIIICIPSIFVFARKRRVEEGRYNSIVADLTNFTGTLKDICHRYISFTTAEACKHSTQHQGLVAVCLR